MQRFRPVPAPPGVLEGLYRAGPPGGGVPNTDDPGYGQDPVPIRATKEKSSMSNPFDLPTHLRYTREHEWAKSEGEDLVVGITAFATSQLGDVVFVELPEPGSSFTAGQAFGVVESVKSVSDLYAPVSGTVTAVNAALRGAPEQVNHAPYDSGWMIRLRPDSPQAAEALLTADQYRATIQG
ncbi:MAG: glycine cleavage system protein GcvH [Magnetococcus sp. WYHC-3]